MGRGRAIYTHDKYTERDQYWNPNSEEYAAASQLLTAMRRGWSLEPLRVKARKIWNSGSRPRTVYDFSLTRGHQLMIMPVLTNPYIERFIIEKGIRVIYDSAPDNIAIPE